LVSDLTEPQVTALSAWLSAPSTTQPPARPALSIPAPPPDCLVLPSSPATDVKGKKKVDIMDNLLIETDLKRNMLADIAHHREIGTYRGKR
jgi:small subunit ribosomal protein S13